MSVEIQLKKVDRIYSPGEVVKGAVIVTSKGSMSHQGVTLLVDGSVQLQLSAKSVGLFEAFYNSIKPVQLLSYSIDVAKPGKLPDGVTELPFEFKLDSASGQPLYETYHGVFVNIQYLLKVEMKRGMMKQDLQNQLQFVVEVSGKDSPKQVVTPFEITPESIDKKSTKNQIPQFKVTGHLGATEWDIREPFTGSFTLLDTETIIKSIELQLVRVETCGCADGYAKEATEIQNIQVADGDLARGLEVPIFMIFPRLFTCPTLATKTFKVEFEVNLVIQLSTNHIITENWPIKLIRGPEQQRGMFGL